MADACNKPGRRPTVLPDRLEKSQDDAQLGTLVSWQGREEPVVAVFEHGGCVGAQRFAHVGERDPVGAPVAGIPDARDEAGPRGRRAA